MREQLAALAELARIDLGFRQLDVEREEALARLEDLRGDVKRMQDLLDREKARLGEAETLRVQTVGEIADISERITRSTARHNASRNTRERDATQRELEVLRREREERTARIAELETVTLQVRAEIARHEDDFSKLQVVLVQDEASTNDRLAVIAERRGEQDLLRRAVIARLRPDIVRRYESIRERKITALAEVHEGVCRACHIAIPPQLYARLHDPRELMHCPSCYRILVLRAVSPGP